MKKRLCLFYLIIIILTSLISCQKSPEIFVSFQNDDSKLIPLLLSKEILDDEWGIMKIFNTQSNQPFSSEAFKGIEETAVIAFWAYYHDDDQNVFLIQHDLYKYEFPPIIPNNLVDSDYKYMGNTDNGIKKIYKV
ncbi:MAG: hypothetical protein UZ14_CFX002000653 [Chloroflexi bacterium OLB14]|nr:MAG: hypothetical protein UZ14_CFX002000653 [Chloroflexi bacterium OLB14]